MRHYDILLDPLNYRAFASLLHDIDCGVAKLPHVNAIEHAERDAMFHRIRTALSVYDSYITLSGDDILYLGNAVVAYAEELERQCADLDTFYPLSAILNALEAHTPYGKDDTAWYAATNDEVLANWSGAPLAPTKQTVSIDTPETVRGHYTNALLNLVEYAPLHERANVSRNRIFMLSLEIKRAGIPSGKPWQLSVHAVEDLAILCTHARRLSREEKQFAFLNTPFDQRIREKCHHALTVYYINARD